MIKNIPGFVKAKLKTTSRSMLDQIWGGILLLALLFLAIKCTATAFTTPFSFDGAMNAQVAQNLVSDFDFATSYAGGKLFDRVITTGIPVVLPVGLFFLLFGESFSSGLMVNAIYLLLVVLALLYYLRSCLKIYPFFQLLAIILFMATPRLFQIGFGLYGEIPMLFFLLMTIIFLHKGESSNAGKFLFAAGLFFGIGYLTKTVILIAVPAILFAMFVDLMVKRRMRLGKFLGQVGLLLVGFIIPITAFELFKLASLGASGYTDWWNYEWMEIQAQAGVSSSFSDTNGLFTKLTAHLQILSGDTGLPGALFTTILAGLLMVFFALLLFGVFNRWGKKQRDSGSLTIFSNGFLVLLTVTLSYFGWWLLITHTAVAWYRRILVGNILLEACCVVLVSMGIDYFWKRAQGRKPPAGRALQARMLTLCVVLLVIFIYKGVITGNLSISFQESPDKANTLAAAEFIRDLPQEAEIFGFGWWQAPVVAFSSGRTFSNLYLDIDLQNGREKYLVMDEYTHWGAQSEIQQILTQYQIEQVFSQGTISIYQVHDRYAWNYPEFTREEKSQVTYNAIDFTATDLSEIITRNVYLSEDNVYGKWAQKYSGYLLHYDDEATLRIVFLVMDLFKYDHHPLTADVMVNEILVASQVIDRAGVNEMMVPLFITKEPVIEVTISCNFRLLPEFADRELSIFMLKMELVK
jgi:4-amino-4-deoxy-L-arabinose transferase-like glycosyltransferase